MMKALKIFLLTILIFSFFEASAETLALTSDEQIQSAKGVSDAIDALSEKVMACIDNNQGKREGCICKNKCGCQFKKDYETLEYLYKEALQKYPSWENKEVFFQLKGNSTGFNVSFSGLKRQLDVSCVD